MRVSGKNKDDLQRVIARLRKRARATRCRSSSRTTAEVADGAEPMGQGLVGLVAVMVILSMVWTTVRLP